MTSLLQTRFYRAWVVILDIAQRAFIYARDVLVGDWSAVFSKTQFLRMIVDSLLVTLALFVAQGLRHLWWEIYRDPISAEPISLTLFSLSHVHSAFFAVLVCLLVFFLSGFYTYGRHYQSAYKLLVVLQAVTGAFLLIATISLLAPFLIKMPRSVLLGGWVLSMLFIAGSRLWSSIWRQVIAREVSNDAGSTVRLDPHGRKRTVLVIGGAGYIGSALVPKLLDQGCRVRILDLLMFGEEPIRDFIGHPDITLIKDDFRQIDVLVKNMRGVDEVVHLGGLVGDPACAFDEELTIDINLAATRAVAEVAKGAGVRKFLFASTCSVYGASDDILDERSNLNPVSLYARSKIASEKVLLEVAGNDFQPIIVRFATIYGISGRTRFDLVVNLLSAKAVLDGKITVFGGDQWRPFLHVDDAARAVSMLLEKPLSPAEQPYIFNVGSSDENYTIGQIGELVHQHVPEADLILSGADGDRRNYRVSFKKIERSIGFTTNWTVEQGILQVLQPIKNGEIIDYQLPLYSNLKFLEEGGSTVLERRRATWAHELIRGDAA